MDTLSYFSDSHQEYLREKKNDDRRKARNHTIVKAFLNDESSSIRKLARQNNMYEYEVENLIRKALR